jgi:hypothetical protein
LIAKMMLFASLLLMPLGMAPALASPMHGPAAAQSAMPHCPDPASQGQKGAIGECTMACAAALPAAAEFDKPPLRRVALPPQRVEARALTDLHPAPATPPPRSS